MTEPKKIQLGPDLSSPDWLRQVAYHDPQLAVALLGGVPRMNAVREQVGVGACNEGVVRPDLLGWGNSSCGWGWEILNISGVFTSGAADTTIPAQLDDPPVTADMWVRKVVYTVSRPNAFAGNILKAQSDYYNKLNPNIKFTLTVKSYCQYVISPDFTPLENIEQVFECVCPIGFVLGCSTNIDAQFINCRALASDEIPTNVTITLHAVRLPTPWGNCGFNQAISALQQFGCLPRHE